MRRLSKNFWKTVFVVLVLLKFAALGGYVIFTGPQDNDPIVSQAVAQDVKPQETAEQATNEPLDSQDEFLEEIKQRRLAQIQEREEMAKATERQAQYEQERLKTVREDLQKALENMQSMEKKVDEKITMLDGKLKEIKGMEEEKLVRLAKVFEETPPEQAGPMLTKLEPKMAAQLMLRMTPRKAGKIWGQVNPEDGVKISEELVKIKQQ